MCTHPQHCIKCCFFSEKCDEEKTVHPNIQQKKSRKVKEKKRDLKKEIEEDCITDPEKAPNSAQTQDTNKFSV